MSDQNADTDSITAPAMPINILAQYVRDVSFENPMAPDSLRAGLANPEMDINIGMDARKIPDEEIENLYEVVVNLRAAATRGDEPVFILELQYGLTVVLNEIPEDNHHPVLLIEIPRLAFPFMRQIVSDLTSQGGYPPLILNPVDFQALYMERFKDEIAQAQTELKKDAPKATNKTDKKPAKTKKK